MMKKISFILLSITIMFGASSCGRKPDTVAKPVNTPAQTETAAPRATINVKENTEEIYIGNRHSKKFHSADCYTLPKEKNRVEFSSRLEAINRGYSPCSNCNP